MTDSLVRRTRLDNGLLVLTESMSHVRTAAFATVLLHGSRDEEAPESGLTHFLEHFLFRGTRGRSGGAGRSEFDIAVETDLLGGDVDASTHRERTSYSSEVAAELLPRAADLLMDIVGRPLLPGDELEREKSVIREEMRSFEDDPVDLASELSLEEAFPDHPLGRPIEGTIETLESFTEDVVRAFWKRKHVGPGLLACAAGRVDHDEVVALVRAGLGDLPDAPCRPGPPAPPLRAGSRVEERDYLEQAQVLLTLPGLPAGHHDEAALAVLATALGGGMSSRLWQRVRESEGLAYDVSLGAGSYRDVGTLVYRAATAPENAGRAIEIFEEEAAAACRGELSAAEIERARLSLRAGLILGLESPAERLADLVHCEIVFGRHLTLEDHLARLDAVAVGDVIELARRMLQDPRRNLVVLGPPDCVVGAS